MRPQDLSFSDNIVTGLEMVLHLGGSPVLETVQDSEDITVKEEVDEKYIEVSTQENQISCCQVVLKGPKSTKIFLEGCIYWKMPSLLASSCLTPSHQLE
jgi:hypothetical protein